MRRIAAALIPLLFAASFALPAAAQSTTVTTNPGIISVDGQGEVMARPDTAIVTSGVMSQGPTAREALDANTADMQSLIAALKAAGIEDRDIQTSGFSVNPNYVYSNETDANGYTLPPKVNGYMVNNSVTVRVRDLSKLGAVLDRAVTVGANTVNGVSFSVADPAKLYDRAREMAYADAKEKAALYAGLANVELGQLVSITESAGYGVPAPYMMRQAADMAMAAPVPVEAGELSFTISVAVSWSLEEK